MGIMQLETLIGALLAAAAFLKRPVQDAATQSIKELFDAVHARLRAKFGENSDGAKFLDLAIQKPESGLRKAVLAEESIAAGVAGDEELGRLVRKLAALLPEDVGVVPQHVSVVGRSNKVQVAAGDIVTTERHVRRAAITPDERHLSVMQRDRIREVAAELGQRLTGGAAGGIAAVHRMLQRRFDVVSYLLIPRTRYEEALSFLRQQRAIHRSRLRRGDPVAYRNDLIRAIFAGARELGWNRDRVHAFAEDKLALKDPLGSLKDLGPVQLTTLTDAVQRAVRTTRAERRREVPNETG